MIQEHIPVLLHEIIEAFNPALGKTYIDATVGFGGHSFEMVKRGARVLGIDRDGDTIKKLTERRRDLSSDEKSRLTLVQGSFADIKRIAEGFDFKIMDGILFDLGFSSWQLDKSGRGLSFSKDEPLDLRFDKQNETTGADILNTYSKKELETVLARYGELDNAEEIADEIVKNRPIWRTNELNAVIARSQTDRSIHQLLARIYQAIRIAVNEELSHIEIGLVDSIQLINKGGTLCAISFHSLEDRIVKLALKSPELKIITKKPILPTEGEINNNSRSKSAKLRIAIKL